MSSFGDYSSVSQTKALSYTDNICPNDPFIAGLSFFIGSVRKL